jgi:HEPN domain-containing protein
VDSKEAYTYFETAEDQLKDAELAFKGGRYALCAFLSASCAENATSALIIVLGAKPSKKHRNSLVLNKLAQSVPSNLQASLREIVESMKILEPHIIKARYPILRGLELYPPSKFYTREKAEEALAQARKIIEAVKPLTGLEQSAAQTSP